MTIEDIASPTAFPAATYELFKEATEPSAMDQDVCGWTRRSLTCDPRRGETVAEMCLPLGLPGGQAQFSRHFKSHFGKRPREIKPTSPQTAER
jgi:hypothetical protein